MFRKMFGRDYRYYKEKGEKSLTEGRYADARGEFAEALQRLPRDCADFAAAAACIEDRMQEAGNRLGEMNLTAAEQALGRGELDNAREYLALVHDLAEDVTIREKAEKLRNAFASTTPGDIPANNKYSCSGCAGRDGKTIVNSHASDVELSPEDRFEILIHTLPGDLPVRYAALGEKFAYGYMLAHDGEDASACNIFKELLACAEDDIVLYETALILHRRGDLSECERLLRRAHTLNEMNPLCCLGLVQLLAEVDRGNEAIPLLDRMIAVDILPDQARVLKGDVLLMLNRELEAMDQYGGALAFPSVAGSAAERLIPMLEGQGRTEEAAYLFKRFMNGCC
jgi:tetratricopeptide (TPR) repeat protein